MKEWSLGAVVKAVLATLLAGLVAVFGGWDDILTTLLIFVSLDIVSGWIRAFIQKELSSDESFRGTAKKVLIFVIVAVAAQADRLTGSDVLRNAVAIFYCASEALSILENTVAAGLPVPEFLSDALKRLSEKKFGGEAKTE